MGNKYGKLDDLVTGGTIQQVYHTIPYTDTVDYEGTFEIAGKLILTILEKSTTGERLIKQVGGKYFLPHQTPILSESGAPVKPERLIGHKITACQRVIHQKKFMGDQYRYHIQLDTGDHYQLVVDRLSCNLR